MTFIAGGGHLDAIRRDGLQVTNPKGDFVVHPASATDGQERVGRLRGVLGEAGVSVEVPNDIHSALW